MPEYLAPGVYVDETSVRAKSLEGVGTSTTAFVGPTRPGPVDGTPELLTSVGDFERIYGGVDDIDGRRNYVAHAVRNSSPASRGKPGTAGSASTRWKRRPPSTA